MKGVMRTFGGTSVRNPDQATNLLASFAQEDDQDRQLTAFERECLIDAMAAAFGGTAKDKNELRGHLIASRPTVGTVLNDPTWKAAPGVIVASAAPEPPSRVKALLATLQPGRKPLTADQEFDALINEVTS